MNHKDKVKLARSLQTKAELIKRVPIFETKSWEARKEAIAKRVARQQRIAHERAVQRREAVKAI